MPDRQDKKEMIFGDRKLFSFVILHVVKRPSVAEKIKRTVLVGNSTTKTMFVQCASGFDKLHKKQLTADLRRYTQRNKRLKENSGLTQKVIHFFVVSLGFIGG
jgi:hypothetical protein